MFRSNFSTTRRYCLALAVLAATALVAPSGQPTTHSYPASAGTGTSTAADQASQGN